MVSCYNLAASFSSADPPTEEIKDCIARFEHFERSLSGDVGDLNVGNCAARAVGIYAVIAGRPESLRDLREIPRRGRISSLRWCATSLESMDHSVECVYGSFPGICRCARRAPVIAHLREGHFVVLVRRSGVTWLIDPLDMSFRPANMVESRFRLSGYAVVQRSC